MKRISSLLLLTCTACVATDKSALERGVAGLK